MAFGDTGTMSIKKHCEGASQLEHGDAWVVSVVLEHCGWPITDGNRHDGSMFWRCDVGEPQRWSGNKHNVRRSATKCRWQATWNQMVEPRHYGCHEARRC
jgi:hypothetical protein